VARVEASASSSGTSGFKYSAWDGSQRGFDLDADALLDEMTDDLLYHGDLHASLRRLMQQGMQDRNGEQLMGLREMLQKLRERRKEMLEHYDLGGVYEEIAASREIESRSADRACRRSALGRPATQILEDMPRQRRCADRSPPDLAGRFRSPAVRLMDGGPALRGGRWTAQAFADNFSQMSKAS
jgi:hypothetical protein